MAASNYTHASDRLLGDAVALWDGGRFDTAGHLAGLAAECALKSILVGLGKFVANPTAAPPKGWRLHIDRLWAQFTAALSGPTGAAYLAGLPSGGLLPHPFADWTVDDRYVADRQLTGEQVERWLWAAICVGGLLQAAKAKTPREAQ